MSCRFVVLITVYWIGTLIIFTGHFVHKSFGNTSNKARYAYTLHCVEGDEKWSEKCWIQRKDNFPQYWTE